VACCGCGALLMGAVGAGKYRTKCFICLGPVQYGTSEICEMQIQSRSSPTPPGFFLEINSNTNKI